MTDNPRIDDRSLAVIGFGEAGRILAGGLRASGRFDVCAYDILVHEPARRSALLAAAVERHVTMAESNREAIRGARIIVSAVTAASSTDVAREAAAALAPGQIFADINSVSPGTKRANAKLIEGAGGYYVDVAVMAIPGTDPSSRSRRVAERQAISPVVLAPKGMELRHRRRWYRTALAATKMPQRKDRGDSAGRRMPTWHGTVPRSKSRRLRNVSARQVGMSADLTAARRRAQQCAAQRKCEAVKDRESGLELFAPSPRRGAQDRVPTLSTPAPDRSRGYAISVKFADAVAALDRKAGRPL